MDFKVFLLTFLAVVAVCTAASQRFLSVRSYRRLSAVDNQCTRPIRSTTSFVMNGGKYYAYSICSNGHILLLPRSTYRLRNYGSPQPLLTVRGYPIVAGFWANNKQCIWRYRRVLVRRSLRRRRRQRRRRIRYRTYYVRRRYRSCPGRVSYGQSNSYSLRTQVRNLVNDYGFFPSSVVWATYSNMYNSIFGSLTNNYQIALASNGRVTYAIFIYGNMGWSRSTGRYRYGYVGYSNGGRRGYQYYVPRTLGHRHLSQSIKIFRISDFQYTTTTSAEQQDAGSLAMLQEAFGQEQHSELELQGDDEDGDGGETVAMDDNELAFTSEDTDKSDEAGLAEEDEGDDDSDSAMVSEDDGDDEEPSKSKGEEMLENLLMQDKEASSEDDGKGQHFVDKKKDTKE